MANTVCLEVGEGVAKERIVVILLKRALFATSSSYHDLGNVPAVLKIPASLSDFKSRDSQSEAG